MWDPKVFSVIMLRCTAQVVSYSVVSADRKVSFIASYVYMENARAQRVAAWSELRDCAVEFRSAWVVLGDFNCLLDESDHWPERIHRC